MADKYVEQLNVYMTTNPELPAAVAAIKVLIDCIKTSNSTTMMGLRKELDEVVEQLVAKSTSAISTKSGCDLFIHGAVRSSQSNDSTDFKGLKHLLIERGIEFVENALESKKKVARLAKSFIRDGTTILTHSHSRVVLKILVEAANHGRKFSVFVTESRPDSSGYTAAEILKQHDIPVTVIMDSAVGYIMEKVDFVLVGAEGVVENGGIVNKIGTYPIALCAKSIQKPVYAVAESFKFVRLFPLSQRELPSVTHPIRWLPEQLGEKGIESDGVVVDFTPPKYIDLLFTDLGVLTPSAVSDELIKLYY